LNKHNHIDTFYIGCENNGERADHNNHILRLNRREHLAHAPLKGNLGMYFFKAQLYHQDKITTEPFKLAIYIRDDWYIKNKKVKEDNAWTYIDTLSFFIENMHPPLGGIIVSLYSQEEIRHSVKGTYTTRYTWPFKKEMQWVGGGDYITLHSVESRSDPSLHFEYINGEESKKHLETIKNIDDISIYPVKKIDYSMGEEKMFSLMKHTKFHVSYPGGTYYTASMMNCPTIGLFLKKKIESSYDWETGRHIKVEMTQEKYVNRLTMTGQYTFDFETNKAVYKHLPYLNHVTNKELICYLKGYSEYVPKITYTTY